MMQITSKQLGWAIFLISAATVTNVWTYLTPAAATVAQEQRSLKEDISYMRERLDAVYDATVPEARRK